jgi:hypothetical protein
MKDENRWRWFTVFAGFLPYMLLLLNNENSVLFSIWILISPLWTIVTVASAILLYDEFNTNKEGAQ